MTTRIATSHPRGMENLTINGSVSLLCGCIDLEVNAEYPMLHVLGTLVRDTREGKK